MTCSLLTTAHLMPPCPTEERRPRRTKTLLAAALIANHLLVTEIAHLCSTLQSFLIHRRLRCFRPVARKYEVPLKGYEGGGVNAGA